MKRRTYLKATLAGVAAANVEAAPGHIPSCSRSISKFRRRARAKCYTTSARSSVRRRPNSRAIST